jgi:hypothetical protein
MTHHEKDFTDYLEEAILKIDATIEKHKAHIRELNNDKYMGTVEGIILLGKREATIFGLEQAKNILLGK